MSGKVVARLGEERCDRERGETGDRQGRTVLSPPLIQKAQESRSSASCRNDEQERLNPEPEHSPA